jgi:hypothetical protein
MVDAINDDTRDTWIIVVNVDGVIEELEWIFDAGETFESIAASFESYFGDNWATDIKIVSYTPILKNHYFKINA